MCEPKAYYCPNPDCGNCAFEPGVCSGCGSTLEEEEMVGTDESLEGWPCRAGFAPDVKPSKVSEQVAALLADLPPHNVCPKCGGMMYHSRLKGYQCPACH